MTADPLSDGPAPPALAAWLRWNVAGFGGPARLVRTAGGQSNPTWTVTAASGRYVLRRRPIGPTLPSAHAIDREYRVLSALAGSVVPVPRAHALCADRGVAGEMFYVMDHVDGRILWDPRLPGWSPADRGALFADMVDVLARLHGLDPAARGLADYGPPAGYLARTLARWTRQYRASPAAPIPAMEALIDWLPAHLPAEIAPRIVHGDYRLDNVMIAEDGPRVAAVLDWELSTLGDPRFDLAHFLLSWEVAPDLFRGLAGADLGALGIPSAQDCVARWASATGIDPCPVWPVLTALALFRTAAILHGIAGRVQTGTAADPGAADLGTRAAPMAERAAEIAFGRAS